MTQTDFVKVTFGILVYVHYISALGVGVGRADPSNWGVCYSWMGNKDCQLVGYDNHFAEDLGIPGGQG